jgi:signal transduction histidine kinase
MSGQFTFSRAASILVAILGSLVLLGWALDIAILKTVFPGAAPLKANAALALILSGISLWFSSIDSGSLRHRIAQGSAALVVLIGLFTLAEHFFGRDFGIDQLLFKDAAADESVSARMNAATAAMLALAGVELGLLAAAVEERIFQTLAVATGVASLLAAAGYFYGVSAFTIVAPHAALGFVLLSLGVLSARPGTGLVANVSGDNIGAVAAMRLLPAAVAAPLVLGYLTLIGQRRGLYGAEAALAFFALSNAFFFILIVLWNARHLVRKGAEWTEAARRARADRERLRALSEGALAIVTAPEPGAVRDILLERTALLVPSAAAATLRLLNRRSGALEPAASRQKSGEAWVIDENKALGRRNNKILETKAPVTIRNLSTDGQVANQLYRKHRWASYAGVPLLARGEVLGILGVYTAERHEFSREEIDCLGTLAGQAALAMGEPLAREREDAPLAKTEFPKTEPAPPDERGQSSLRHLPELYAALAPLQTAESIGETTEGIIDRLMEATGADAALVRVWKKETGLSLLTAHRGLPDDAARQIEVGLLGGAAEWVMQNGEPIFARDIDAEPRFKTKVQQQLGLRSAAVLPLKIHGDVRGLLYIASRTPGRFDEGQKDLLAAIAQQMGVSMANRELIVHLKDSRDEVEKASKVKDEFLSVMSHELRTPLSVVIGYAGMVKEKMLGEINPQQEEALQKLLLRANDQLNMINAIMQITQLESRALVLERHLVNLSELLTHLESDYALSHTKEQVALKWNYSSDPIAIVTDSGKLKEILVNLINNAIKFTAQGGVTVSMRVTEDQRKKWVAFEIADTGVGIADEHRAAIFDKFYQVDSSETRLYGGAGLGLYIVKHFTEFLGGRVEVSSKPGEGSTFTVMIPYAT